jgi:hypothetical protein
VLVSCDLCKVSLHNLLHSVPRDTLPL